jgi:branched-chain amino acid aminotransferase
MSAANQSGHPTNMEDMEGMIWVDGALVPWREAKVHLLSQTLQQGLGVFEGVRAYSQASGGAAIFRLRDHTERLFRSAKMLDIALPFSLDEIDQAQLTVIRHNGLGSCYLRPLVYLGGEVPGVSARGNSVHVAIAAWVWNHYMGAEAKKQGIRLKTSSFSRPHGSSLMCQAKATGNYVLAGLAHGEAKHCGYDDALMLDSEGHMAEASTSNLFVVRRGRVVTPDSTSVLQGITRDTVKCLLSELGIEVLEQRVSREEVYTGDELFLTGTAAEITPVREVDGRVIGQGVPGKITRAVQEAYEKAVRGLGTDHGWLTAL